MEGEEPSEVPEQEKKRVRLTVGVSPEEGREKKKSVKKKEEKKGDGVSGDVEGVQQVSHLRRNVVEMDKDKVGLLWDPGDFEMEHIPRGMWSPTGVCNRGQWTRKSPAAR